MLDVLGRGGSQAILAAFPQPGRLRPASSQIELDKLLHFCLSVKELLSVGAGQRNAANEMLYRANSETQRTGKLQRLKTMTMSSKNLVPEEPQKAGLLDPGVSGDNACPQRSSLPDKVGRDADRLYL